MGKGVLLALVLVPGLASSGWGEILQATAPPSAVPETALTYFQQVEGQRFDEFLHRLRPGKLSAEVKERLLKIVRQDDVVSPTAKQEAKLRALAPVLRYHDRESAIDIKVLRVRPATMVLLAGAAILVTLPALEILSVEELQAAVAHELGHEYFWGEFELARQQGQYSKLQELELRCDGIAVITLDRLALNPGSLIGATRKLNRYNGNKETDRTGQRYVSSDAREAFIRSMIGMVREAARRQAERHVRRD